jgi:hypothetical protein
MFKTEVVNTYKVGVHSFTIFTNLPSFCGRKIDKFTAVKMQIYEKTVQKLRKFWRNSVKICKF